jgi:hypothetical protein
MARTECRVLAAVGLLCAVIAFTAPGCSESPPEGVGQDTDATEIRRLPLDTLSVVLTRSDVEFDPNVSSDGNGSLRVTASAPMTVRIYEMGPMAVDDARLIYQARVRTSGVKGRVYLEMWCRIAGKGALSSRGLASALSGTTGWTVLETPFFLQKGERPENVGLNLVVDGTGTAWIDDIRLLQAPLE